MSKSGQVESERGAVNNAFGVTDVNEAAVGKAGHVTTLLILLSFLKEPGETALHLAVRTADRTSLHFVHFLVQNWYGFCFLGICPIREDKPVL